ncbi:hypothetical protein PCE1_003361 [Barthelona sp. PCE]
MGKFLQRSVLLFIVFVVFVQGKSCFDEEVIDLLPGLNTFSQLQDDCTLKINREEGSEQYSLLFVDSNITVSFLQRNFDVLQFSSISIENSSVRFICILDSDRMPLIFSKFVSFINSSVSDFIIGTDSTDSSVEFHDVHIYGEVKFINFMKGTFYKIANFGDFWFKTEIINSYFSLISPKSFTEYSWTEIHSTFIHVRDLNHLDLKLHFKNSRKIELDSLIIHNECTIYAEDVSSVKVMNSIFKGLFFHSGSVANIEKVIFHSSDFTQLWFANIVISTLSMSDMRFSHLHGNGTSVGIGGKSYIVHFTISNSNFTNQFLTIYDGNEVGSMTIDYFVLDNCIVKDIDYITNKPLYNVGFSLIHNANQVKLMYSVFKNITLTSMPLGMQLSYRIYINDCKFFESDFVIVGSITNHGVSVFRSEFYGLRIDKSIVLGVFKDNIFDNVVFEKSQESFFAVEHFSKLINCTFSNIKSPNNLFVIREEQSGYEFNPNNLKFFNVYIEGYLFSMFAYCGGYELVFLQDIDISGFDGYGVLDMSLQTGLGNLVISDFLISDSKMKSAFIIASSVAPVSITNVSIDVSADVFFNVEGNVTAINLTNISVVFQKQSVFLLLSSTEKYASVSLFNTTVTMDSNSILILEDSWHASFEYSFRYVTVRDTQICDGFQSLMYLKEAIFETIENSLFETQRKIASVSYLFLTEQSQSIVDRVQSLHCFGCDDSREILYEAYTRRVGINTLLEGHVSVVFGAHSRQAIDQPWEIVYMTRPSFSLNHTKLWNVPTALLSIDIDLIDYPGLMISIFDANGLVTRSLTENTYCKAGYGFDKFDRTCIGCSSGHYQFQLSNEPQCFTAENLQSDFLRVRLSGTMYSVDPGNFIVESDNTTYLMDCMNSFAPVFL